MNDHRHHFHHHQLIEDRVAAWRSAPRRSGLDKLRRREALKTASWSITGHLRCCHGWRGQTVGLGPDELLLIHQAYHTQGEDQ